MRQQISRRAVSALLGAGMAGAALGTGASYGQQQAKGKLVGAQGAPTAAQVVDKIKAKLAGAGIAYREGSTVDIFKIGDITQPITGIATTFMSSLDVLKRAHAQGLSFIISHEPTFWSPAPEENQAAMANDPLYKLKTKYALDNGLVVWRFHDHWHMVRPDPFWPSLADKLGWSKNFDLESRTFKFDPPITLAAAARHARDRYGSPIVRYGGDPKHMVKSLKQSGHALSAALNSTEEDFLWSEPKESNVYEYVRDAQALGIQRNVIGTSHELIEEWGMAQSIVDWLRPLAPGLPIEHVKTTDLYWVPKAGA